MLYGVVFAFRYEQQLKESQIQKEDLSDMVAEHAAKQKASCPDFDHELPAAFQLVPGSQGPLLKSLSGVDHGNLGKSQGSDRRGNQSGFWLGGRSGRFHCTQNSFKNSAHWKS